MKKKFSHSVIQLFSHSFGHSFRQAWQMMKENPLVSLISITGTALSIAMIMVIVLVFQINLTGYRPVSNRDRMLFVGGIEAFSESQNYTHRTSMSAEVVKACFYSLQTPRAVTALCKSDAPVSLPAQRMFKEYTVAYTDAGFWEVFDFSFVYGHPFTEADFSSAIPRAVIASDVAEELLGKGDVTGRTILLNDVSYTVAGVVRPVSRAAGHAFARVWVPYTTHAILLETLRCEGICGRFQTVMLAHSRADFGRIREELKQQTEQYNAGKRDTKLGFLDNPLTRLDLATGSNAFNKTSAGAYFLRMGLLLFFLLLVPALNLTGVIQSAVQKRRSEMGIRKAFGATRRTLVGQVLYENLLTTCMGGAAGLALSFMFLPVCKSFMLGRDMLLTTDMLFNPRLFAAALLLTALLNLLSAGIPALHISRQNTVDAIRGSE
jgi:putative ABC transport system permease protein